MQQCCKYELLSVAFHLNPVQGMSLFNVIVKNARIWEGLKSLSLILLLALYTASGTGYGLLHEHQSFVSHSIEEENDPCHKAIYHIDADNACSHESHVSKHEKCCACHLLCHPDQIIARSSFTESVYLGAGIKCIFLESPIDDISHSHPSRGPPRS
jgi:hypothetical protein